MKKKRYTAEQGYNDLTRLINRYKDETVKLNQDVERNFGLRLSALEETGVDRSRIEKVEQQLRFLLKSERETREVLGAMLKFMRVSKDFNPQKDETQP